MLSPSALGTAFTPLQDRIFSGCSGIQMHVVTLVERNLYVLTPQRICFLGRPHMNEVSQGRPDPILHRPADMNRKEKAAQISIIFLDTVIFH